MRILAGIATIMLRINSSHPNIIPSYLKIPSLRHKMPPSYAPSQLLFYLHFSDRLLFY